MPKPEELTKEQVSGLWSAVQQMADIWLSQNFSEREMSDEVDHVSKMVRDIRAQHKPNRG